MKFEFNVKYGINVLNIPINGGITIRFKPKYGRNIIAIPTTNTVLFFNIKYGKNVIDIPEEEKRVEERTGLFTKKATIFNDVPSDGVNPRRFDKYVIEQCNIQKGMLQNADGTIEKVVNAIAVITKDIEHYKTPIEYAALPFDKKDKYFTARVNDFIVLSEVDDVVTTSKEFQDLQNKYKDNGFSVTSVNEYLNGMSVDNVQIIHA